MSSAIARGKITGFDLAAARAVPGVIDILTHENRPSASSRDKAWHDAVAPNGSPFKPLSSPDILFAQQPVAVVIADTFEAARQAALLVRVEYDAETPHTELGLGIGAAVNPKGDGTYQPEHSRGDFATAYNAATHRVAATYKLAPEHHNPMEPHATTAHWRPGGSLLIHDKTQGVQNPQAWLAGIFGLKPEQVHVVAPFMGGGFGCGLRPQYQTFLAAAAAKLVDRPVKVVLTRQQMFSHQYRPHVVYDIALAANAAGQLQAISSDCVGATSQFEISAENVVNWGPQIYRCDNAKLDYRVTPIDTYTPGPMRAPGAATGLNLFEIAMDELAYKVGIDPLALRRINYSDHNELTGAAYTSKALGEAYTQGAARFGWERRTMAPRSMRDGRELVGWGMATGCWETLFQAHTVRAKLNTDGRLEVATASADIGTGTYTIMTQIASEEMGLPVNRIDALLGDSQLPMAPVEGGSWGRGVDRQRAGRRVRELARGAGRGGAQARRFTACQRLGRAGGIRRRHDAAEGRSDARDRPCRLHPWRGRTDHRRGERQPQGPRSARQGAQHPPGGVRRGEDRRGTRPDSRDARRRRGGGGGGSSTPRPRAARSSAAS